MQTIKRLLLTTAMAVSMIQGASAAVFDGPYVGVEAGYSMERSDLHVYSGLAGVDARDKDNNGAFNGGAFAGYGKRHGNFYLGGETHLDWNGLDRTKADGTETFVQKHSIDAALDLRAGFFPASSVLLYGILGAAYGKFEYSDTDPTVPIAATSDKWLAGIRGGLGAEAQLSSNTSARIDWVYTQYQPATSDIMVAGTSVGRVKVSPTTNVFHAGVAFAF